MPHNRTDILNLLALRINSFSEGYRQNIALLGEPCIGKTSLIKQLLDSGDIKKEAIITVYIEIKIEPFEFYAKRFIKSALFQLLHSDPLVAQPHDAVVLIEDIARQYPKTAEACQRVLRDIERGRLDEAYSYMLDIPAAIYEESKKRCLLILDEFHNLGNFTLKHAFGTLAKKIMIQKDTMFFLISSKNTLSQRLLAEKLSLLFGNFEKIFMPSFDTGMSRTFLQGILKNISLPQVYMDFIASFTGNKPFYMRVICDEIERAVFSGKVDRDNYPALIEYAFTASVFRKNGVLNNLFSSFFFKISDGKFLSCSAAALIALSSENKKQHEITKSARLQSRDCSKILNRLVEMDIIVRNGSLYRFRERLFAFWLKSVYMKRIMSFSIDETVEENCFEKEIAGHLNAFLIEFEKELFSRITDLFKLFKNDVIQLNGRRHKFISFNSVQRLENNLCNGASFTATNDKLNWLCTVKKEPVTESDVSNLVNTSRKKKDKVTINRNIVIALAGINENAYLMAKEAKFWVWDLDSLNILMELYGKPHIY
ncbi:MAG: ATP-binding protein [Candidatus Omnitrophica bacterium]|nr:ATP-binding protein [Candidatus Omnitrophota bacterium]